MKKYLLPKSGNFYKANLHTHSTCSDGINTPAELKERYKSLGYSILAITDHELIADHSDLDDEKFLMLTGCEYAVMEKYGNYNESKTVEFNLIAKDQHNVNQICYNPKYVGHSHDEEAKAAKYVGELVDREFTIEFLQKVVDEATKNGFLVSLNHPQYSMITPDFFGQLNGLWAMEIYNNMSMGAGYWDYNPAMYDDMLRRGKRLFCLATDDCHSISLPKYEFQQNGGGFVMIKSDELKYDKIITALENGDFYASQGPEIYNLYVEDGKIHIKCSPARTISMISHHRPFGGTAFAKDGILITEAEFEFQNQPFFRFDICDYQGRHANTRAYYVTENGEII